MDQGEQARYDDALIALDEKLLEWRVRWDADAHVQDRDPNFRVRIALDGKKVRCS